jgi:hypothetical protein
MAFSGRGQLTHLRTGGVALIAQWPTRTPPLPIRQDAAAVAQVFRNAAFDVVEVQNNLGVNDLRVRRNLTGGADADISVYFAGHQVDGVNYLSDRRS